MQEPEIQNAAFIEGCTPLGRPVIAIRRPGQSEIAAETYWQLLVEGMDFPADVLIVDRELAQIIDFSAAHNIIPFKDEEAP